MKPSYNNQPFVPNKKLILHFDVDNVLRINHANKDLFVRFINNSGVFALCKMGLGQIVKDE